MDSIAFKKREEASGNKKDLSDLVAEDRRASVWFQKGLGHGLQDTGSEPPPERSGPGGGVWVHEGDRRAQREPGTTVTGDLRWVRVGSCEGRWRESSQCFVR